MKHFIGTFYSQELQKVRLKYLPIEKKIKRRVRKKQDTKYFMKYRGYPNIINQWLPANNLLSLSDTQFCQSCHLAR